MDINDDNLDLLANNSEKMKYIFRKFEYNSEANEECNLEEYLS